MVRPCVQISTNKVYQSMRLEMDRRSRLSQIEGFACTVTLIRTSLKLLINLVLA